jgi:hypothetical protein
MNKEFVTYEQSLALKELGFDEPCLAGYDLNKSMYVSHVTIEDSQYYSSFELKSPLNSQVFRWFRDIWFLDSEIYLQEELGHKFYHYLILQLVRGNIEWKSKNTIKFKTYEDAENACIDKLIELVKEQNNG